MSVALCNAAKRLLQREVCIGQLKRPAHKERLRAVSLLQSRQQYDTDTLVRVVFNGFAPGLCWVVQSQPDDRSANRL